jgi:hypothetical protein
MRLVIAQAARDQVGLVAHPGSYFENALAGFGTKRVIVVCQGTRNSRDRNFGRLGNFRESDRHEVFFRFERLSKRFL